MPGGDGVLGGFGGGPFRVLKDPEIRFKLYINQILKKCIMSHRSGQT